MSWLRQSPFLRQIAAGSAIGRRMFRRLPATCRSSGLHRYVKNGWTYWCGHNFSLDQFPKAEIIEHFIKLFRSDFNRVNRDDRIRVWFFSDNRCLRIGIFFVGFRNGSVNRTGALLIGFISPLYRTSQGIRLRQVPRKLGFPFSHSLRFTFQPRHNRRGSPHRHQPRCRSWNSWQRLGMHPHFTLVRLRPGSSRGSGVSSQKTLG